MPEIKHNFIKGRMNKDFDERLVPNGEYRDALNIEVSTSEGSNVGAAQTVKGNTLSTIKDQNSNSFTLSDNAITVGSHADESTKTIFNFIHKASDLTSTGTFSGRTRFEGYRSDVISMYTALSAGEDGVVYPLVTDVYESRIRPTEFQTSANGIITGVPTESIEVSPGVNVDYPKGVRVGMRVRLVNPSGVDLYGGDKVIVKQVLASTPSDSAKIITTKPISNFTFNSVNDNQGFVFKFTSDRILNFQHGPLETEVNTSGTPTSNTPDGTMITAINYKDNILFYTDGRTEPKRIIIDRFKLRSGDYDTNASITRHSQYRVDDKINTVAKTFTEDHITVIRKNPTTPPVVVPVITSRTESEIQFNGVGVGVYYENTTSSKILQIDGTTGVEFAMADSSQVKYEPGQDILIQAQAGRVNWRVGDVLELTGSLTTTRARASITVVHGTSSSGVQLDFREFTINLIEIDEDYSGESQVESWQAQLVEKDAIYLDKFIYFAYRYKYIDGEFSCISPYSTTTFVPGFFSYNPKNGFNRGMESICKFIKVTDFVPPNIPDDVESVEVLLKDSSSELVQIIKEVKRDSQSFIDEGTHFKGKIELNSESFGSSVPSDQLLRPFDAVPRTAKAQEFSGSRLLYGNYVDGYNLKSKGNVDLIPSMQQSIEVVNNDFTTSIITDNHLEGRLQTNLLTPGTYPKLGSTITSGAAGHVFYTNNTGITGQYPTYIHNQADNYNNYNVYFIYEQLSTLFAGAGLDNGHNSWPGFQILPINVENEDPGSNYNLNQYCYTISEPGSYDIFASTKFAFVATEKVDMGIGNDPVISAQGANARLMICKVDADGNLLHTAPPHGDFSAAGPTGVNTIDPDTILLAGQIEQSYLDGSPNGNLFSGYMTIPTAGGTNTQNIAFTRLHDVSWKYINVTGTLNTDTNPNFNVGDRIAAFLVTPGGPGNDSNNTDGTFAGFNRFGTGRDHGRHLKLAHCFFNIDAPSSDQAIVETTGGSSVKSLRTYEVGVVYLDGKGRESTVVLDETTNIKVLKTNSITRNKIKVKINHLAPLWAEYYKFFIKEIGPTYNNIVLYRAYPNDNQDTIAGAASYVWLSFNSNDRNKVSINDYLVLKKEHGENVGVTDVNAKFRVLDIVGSPEKVEDDPDTGFEEQFEIKGVPIQASKEDVSGKFFVKIEADKSYSDYINANDTIPTDENSTNNGAVFEVEKPLNLDLDLFYEASQAYPILLTRENRKAETFIRRNSKVRYVADSGYSLYPLVSGLTNQEFTANVSQVLGAATIYNGIYETLGDVNDNYFCKLTLDNSFPQGTNTSLVSYSSPMLLEISSEDGGVITVYCIKVDGNDFYIHPFTHKINQQDYFCSTITLPWTNCYAFGNGVESDRIRDDFNANTTYPYIANGKTAGFKASLFLPSYREVQNKNDIIFSQIYNDATNTARYNEFIAAQDITKKLNSEYGSIQKLYTRNSDVLAFCENKVVKILANKDALFNADGNPQLLATNKVLGQATPMAGDYGISNNPESFAVEEYRIYFADKFRGAVCRLSIDGITPINEAGMKDFFNDNLETASALVGSYDGKKGEYNLTIHSSTNPGNKKNVYTVSYKESAKGWVSFKSFIKESGLSMSNEYYTFKNGDMYLHHPDQTDVSRNNFYGTQYTSTIDVMLNDFSGSVKLFKTINYEGTQAKEI